MPADIWPYHTGAMGIVLSMGSGFWLPTTSELVYIAELVILSNVCNLGGYSIPYYVCLNDEKTEA